MRLIFKEGFLFVQYFLSIVQFPMDKFSSTDVPNVAILLCQFSWLIYFVINYFIPITT